ncbi:MAG: MBL fold metallo-hydrolase [Planctomycetes bacterium]|nr:MBL fold metallo-hydrolase [Planctomycetota bacterium]
MNIGRFQVNIVSDGFFKLDGGAMFGIIPKPLWEKSSAPDSLNRIQLSLNPLLIRINGKNILVDTGIGNKYDQRFNEMYAIDHKWSLPGSLKEIGLTTSDIHYVVPSHLHFDHMGGATIKIAGSLESTFPKAMFIIQEQEWENALSTNPRNKGSYFAEDMRLLEKKKQIKLINGRYEVTEGLEVIKTGGHTPGHQIVRVADGTATAVYAGDLIPTKSHLKPAWCMGYDLFPLDVAEWKVSFLKEAAEKNWILFFDHEVEMKAVNIVKTDKGYDVAPISL